MIQSLYQNGLKVETISPFTGSLSVSIYDSIKLTFNSELNTGTIFGNVAFFEDVSGIYTDIESLKNNPDLFAPVSGNLTYKDRVITFTPDALLKKLTKYVICVKADGISDILGNKTSAEQVFYFVTEGPEIDAKVSITAPAFGDVVDTINEISWSDVGSDAYYIEISKQPTFEITLYTYVCKKDSILNRTPSRVSVPDDFEDGLYYIRARALNGPWSELVQVFVKKIQQALTSEEDIADIIDRLNIDDVPLDLMEMFPPNGESSVNLNLNVIYFKFRGYVDFDEVNLRDSSIEMLDIADEDGIPSEVPGEWVCVYDETEDASYLIFKIEK